MTSPIQQTLDTTWAFLQTRTLAGLSSGERATLLALPALVTARAAVEDCALTGDVVRTRAACQQWQRLVKAAVAAQYAARCRTPGTPAGWPHAWVQDGTGTYCLRCAAREPDTKEADAAAPRPRALTHPRTRA